MINSKIIPKAIFLMGPTASKKTELSIKLRKFLPIEIINVDSGSIYKDMDIGTAKPTIEQLNLVPHHLFSIIDPVKIYSVANFYHDALSCMKKITLANKIPLLVGGSMFYYKVLLNGLFPFPQRNEIIRKYLQDILIKKGKLFLYNMLLKVDPFNKNIHKNDLQRVLRALEIFFITGKNLSQFHKEKKSIPYNILQFAIFPINKYKLHHEIKKRFNNMLNLGFEQEVKNLFQRKDIHKNLPSMRCVGYRQMWEYLSGNIHYNNMIEKTLSATNNVVKNQITWIKNWKDIYFLNNNNLQIAKNKILKIINNK